MKFPPAKRNAKDQAIIERDYDIEYRHLFESTEVRLEESLISIQDKAYALGLARGFEMGQVMPKFNTEQNTETNPETNPETETTSP